MSLVLEIARATLGVSSNVPHAPQCADTVDIKYAFQNVVFHNTIDVLIPRSLNQIQTAAENHQFEAICSQSKTDV